MYKLEFLYEGLWSCFKHIGEKLFFKEIKIAIFVAKD